MTQFINEYCDRNGQLIQIGEWCSVHNKRTDNIMWEGKVLRFPNPHVCEFWSAILQGPLHVPTSDISILNESQAHDDPFTHEKDSNQ